MNLVFDQPQKLEEIYLEIEAANNSGAENDFQDFSDYKNCSGDAKTNPSLSQYEIVSCVLHLGKQINCGHYVCYVKKDGKWIYYNDSRVNHSIDTP